MYQISFSYIIYFIIIYTIHIIQALHIINIHKFNFKRTSLFVTVVKTQFIYPLQLFFVDFAINVLLLLVYTFLAWFFSILLQDIIYWMMYHII